MKKDRISENEYYQIKGIISSFKIKSPKITLRKLADEVNMRLPEGKGRSYESIRIVNKSIDFSDYLVIRRAYNEKRKKNDEEEVDITEQLKAIIIGEKPDNHEPEDEQTVEEFHEERVCNTFNMEFFIEQFAGISKALDDYLIVPGSADGRFKDKTVGTALNDIGAACGSIKKIIINDVIAKLTEISNSTANSNRNSGLISQLCEAFNYNATQYDRNLEHQEERMTAIENKLDYLINMWEPSANSAEI